ncbi:MAG TPA: hypothetical protein DDY77_06020, partial [Clostridiales bacterium]|nr:hypothetical protein [Clostridiales bacterium]
EEDNFYLTDEGVVVWYSKMDYSIAVENGWVKLQVESSSIIEYYNYLSENDLKYYTFNCPYEIVDINQSETTNYNSSLFDDGVVFFMRDDNLCYGENLWECMKNQTEVEYKTILSGCIYDGYNETLGQIVFKKAGINGEVYYTVKETIVGGKRMYEAVEAGSYEGKATSFTLQPLNR